MPSDTAPAGYTCPTCMECIFPPDNLVSPVADQLRETLKEVNWARAGLGMPLLEPRSEKRPEFNIPTGPRPTPEGQTRNEIASTHGHDTQQQQHQDHVVGFDTPTSRKAIAGSTVAHLKTSPLLMDPDENKYQRKSGFELLMRWIRTTLGSAGSARRRQSPIRRYLMLVLILFVGFATFLAILSYSSR